MRLLACTLLLGGTACPSWAQPVLWAWERPEDLQSLPPSYGVAVLAGFIRLRGEAVAMRGRRFPLRLAPGRHKPSGVVHIEIDQSQPLEWTPALRARITSAALSYAQGFQSVQLDMEVRRSQRGALLDVLHGMRAGLPSGTLLSMTALASWCDTEDWLAAAPVDEIVPMLFRMGSQGYRLRARLAAGGDFAQPSCRKALGISLDSPVSFPPGRRVYVFNPRSWDAESVASLARMEDLQ